MQRKIAKALHNIFRRIKVALHECCVDCLCLCGEGFAVVARSVGLPWRSSPKPNLRNIHATKPKKTERDPCASPQGVGVCCYATFMQQNPKKRSVIPAGRRREWVFAATQHSRNKTQKNRSVIPAPARREWVFAATQHSRNKNPIGAQTRAASADKPQPAAGLVSKARTWRCPTWPR